MVIWNSVKRWTSSICSVSYTEGQKNCRSSTDWSSQIRMSLCFHQWGYCKDEEMKCASLLPVDKFWKLYAEWNKSHIKEHPDCPLALLVEMSLPLITQITFQGNTLVFISLLSPELFSINYSYLLISSSSPLLRSPLIINKNQFLSSIENHWKHSKYPRIKEWRNSHQWKWMNHMISKHGSISELNFE